MNIISSYDGGSVTSISQFFDGNSKFFLFWCWSIEAFNSLCWCLLKTAVKLIKFTDFLKFVYNVSKSVINSVLLWCISVSSVSSTLLEKITCCPFIFFSWCFNSCLNLHPRLSCGHSMFLLKYLQVLTPIFRCILAYFSNLNFVINFLLQVSYLKVSYSSCFSLMWFSDSEIL